MPPAVLALQSLHERHPGIDLATAAYYAEAALVCASRHHKPPLVWRVLGPGPGEAAYEMDWSPVPTTARRSFANAEDATRDGAYGVALAATEAHLSLVALRRAESLTGADFYLVSQGSPVPDDPHLDLERSDLVLLEVSGIDDDDDRRMRARLRAKAQQIRDGRLPLPGYAAVVGFRTARVMFIEASG